MQRDFIVTVQYRVTCDGSQEAAVERLGRFQGDLHDQKVQELRKRMGKKPDVECLNVEVHDV